MGAGQDAGVVNHKCQVFDGRPQAPADAVHPGLYVCDGSVVPRPLGRQPVADDHCARRARHDPSRQGSRLGLHRRADATCPAAVAAPEGRGKLEPAGAEFTERMAGYLSGAVNVPHETAARRGKEAGTTLSFTVTVVIDDVDRFVDDKQHRGRIIGSVLCPSLSPEPLEIFDGVFNLMSVDESAVETKRFEYKFSLGARDGSDYYFEGYKLVRSDADLDLWRDTTRLFIDIGKGAKGELGHIARGLLEIAPNDFYVQMQTLKGTGGQDAADRLRAVGKFGRFFSRELFDTYGGVLVRLGRYDVVNPRKKRTLRAPEPEIHLVKTTDDKILKLTRYRGGHKGPVVLSHGLGRVEPHLLDRHHRDQPARVSDRGRLRLLDARLPGEHRSSICARVVDRRRRRDQGLSGRRRKGAGADRRADRAGARALLWRYDLLHGDARRSRGCALGRHLSDLDRLHRALVSAALLAYMRAPAAVRG